MALAFKRGAASRLRLWGSLVAALIVVLVAWWGVDLWNRSELQEEARAVRVLPPGVEAAWQTYVDHETDRTVQPHGDVVKIVSEMGRTFVSRDTPFSVDCYGSMAELTFGSGDESVMAFIPNLGSTTDPDRPPLGVDPDSVAASKLWDRLCDRIADRIQNIITAPVILPDPPPLPSHLTDRAAVAAAAVATANAAAAWAAGQTGGGKPAPR